MNYSWLVCGEYSGSGLGCPSEPVPRVFLCVTPSLMKGRYVDTRSDAVMADLFPLGLSITTLVLLVLLCVLVLCFHELVD